MNGKVLCLRGGHEHKSLNISQFNFGSDQGGDFVVYTENGSEKRSGTYKEKAGDNKLVKHYANTQLGNCYVFLSRFYLQKLAPKVLEDHGLCLLLETMGCSPSKWFHSMVHGTGHWQNVLALVVKRMFQEVGIDGKTNHSLQVTGASRLCEANVPEKLIKEWTGHKSLDALRLYKCTSSEQQKSVPNVLNFKLMTQPRYSC